MKYLPLKAQKDQRVGYQQFIKEQNIKRVFDLVRSGRCASRAELVRTMHLSATTISALVEELQEMGLIVETGPTMTSTPGRRPMRLRLNYAGRQLAIFSLSRRGVRYTLFDLGCRPIESLFVEHAVGEEEGGDQGEDYAALFEEVLLRKSKCFNRANAIVIGVSFPGIYLEEEQAFSVRAAMNVSFSEESMMHLEQRIGVPLLLGNVSMCLAYAEKKCIDAGRASDDELRDLIFINICDGVGAGIISEGAILAGPSNTAGEFGHITIDPNGVPCKCGNRGCLEQYVNQNAILRRVQAACEAADRPAPQAFSELEGVYARIPEARPVLDSIAEQLASGVYALTCVMGIHRVVVGGNAGILGAEFLEMLQEHVRSRHLLAGRTEVSYGHAGPEGDSAGLAHYFLDKTYTISLPGSR